VAFVGAGGEVQVVVKARMVVQKAEGLLRVQAPVEALLCV